MLSKESLARVIEAGGSLKISTLNKESLVELANLAKRHGTRLEIKGSLTVESMVEIVNAGGGSVSFDVS